MPYNDKPLKTNGMRAVPQGFEPAKDEWKVNTTTDLGNGRAGIDQVLYGKKADGSFAPINIGTNGEMLTSVTGSMLAQTKTNADAVGGVLTFSQNINYIEILNRDTVNDGIFTVNGLAIHVPKGQPFTKTGVQGTIGKTVTVTGSTSYVVNQYV
ncbi:hypothetical protein ACFFJY_09380 [Fictibacillus aquaticus]|uniref:Uncharacterized protein n=1 Tax=Fictibacillus aquaticus TaxID=2021314 RepID=A0A235FCG8_9BACL|nr:hypothetical protein [Fictibacillus aquaticus]OYD58485.1 hypothetical protein CGZ90_00870 [Fictibacillus aquaticus]